ncbi:MAG: 2-succinyl-5-enolpyruvyl-6-hydroxy-3-cyclohexene-1-carboxylic-acid synthase [Verrucomicrobia bacterium]|nr:2-succinyl-5-enolpyruvyl-6-hydroxy-3-cyclohexene-1-carboxylic-acid synthase [Verrucomicrobiota bacterium]
MSTSSGVLNDQRGRLIIDRLVQNGVSTFLVAPGSRCTPLVLAVGERDDVEAIVHFDERGLAFYGLGMAKASGKPVAIICTSGTAIANLYPAIVEASLDHVPMIFLCADRPFELRDCGANQTIDQVKMFGDYLRFECDLPCADGMTPDSAVASSIDHAYYASTALRGPVVLNCMFREPLFSSTPSSKVPMPRERHYHQSIKMLPKEVLEELGERLSKVEKGVIVVGNLPYSPYLNSILVLAEKLQWPVFADPLSHVRCFGEHPCLIPYYNTFLPESPPDVEVVLHFGGQIVSKTLNNWLGSSSVRDYIHVTEFRERNDPFQRVTERVEMTPHLFCSHLPVEPTSKKEYLTLYQEKSISIKKMLEEEFNALETLLEPLAIFSLASEVDSETTLFFGNSLSIRYADSFFFPKRGCGPIFGNRGVSGIDGNIATIGGIAKASKKPLLGVIGDYTFLHDVNSLALLQDDEIAVQLIVLNNQGGAIFKYLPIASSPHLDRFFVSKHDLKIEPFAKAFNLPYSLVTSLENLEGATKIVEIASNSDENYLFMQSLKEKASCSTFAKSR